MKIFLDENEKMEIEKARRKAYIDEKKKIEAIKAREKARTENQTILDKGIKFIRGLFYE